MLTVQITGLAAVERSLGDLGRQARFAASVALNATAFEVNKRVKADMQRVFQGGASPYALRAFRVDRATKATLTSTVGLRTDAPAGGTPYAKALRHLFTSGQRDWKKLEGLLRGRGLLPQGLMAVPGRACPLDARGNIRRGALREMLGGLGSGRGGLRVYRNAGASKGVKAVGYFAAVPGNKTGLAPGIYKRVEQGGRSGLQPMVMFVRRGNWRQFIDLQKIGVAAVASTFNTEFNKALDNALRTAK